jgi:hypothetical protein
MCQLLHGHNVFYAPLSKKLDSLLDRLDKAPLLTTGAEIEMTLVTGVA